MINILAANNFFDAISGFEKRYLEHQITLNDNKVSLTAEKIGLERTTLYKRN